MARSASPRRALVTVAAHTRNKARLSWPPCAQVCSSASGRHPMGHLAAFDPLARPAHLRRRRDERDAEPRRAWGLGSRSSPPLHPRSDDSRPCTRSPAFDDAPGRDDPRRLRIPLASRWLVSRWWCRVGRSVPKPRSATLSQVSPPNDWAGDMPIGGEFLTRGAESTNDRDRGRLIDCSSPLRRRDGSCAGCCTVRGSPDGRGWFECLLDDHAGRALTGGGEDHR